MPEAAFIDPPESTTTNPVAPESTVVISPPESTSPTPSTPDATVTTPPPADAGDDDTKGAEDQTGPEQQRGPESLRGRYVAKETEMLASNLILGKVTSSERDARRIIKEQEAAEGRTLTDREQDEIIDGDPQLRLYRNIGFINDQENGLTADRFADGQQLELSTNSDDEPIEIAITPEGYDEPQVVQIALITGVSGDSVFCSWTADGGTYMPITLTRSELTQALVAANKDIVVQSFDGNVNAQAIVDTYIDSMDPSVPEEKRPKIEASADMDHALEAVAEEQGLITSADVRTFLTKLPAEAAIDEGRARNLLGRLEGKTILSAEDIGSLFTVSGFTPESMENNILELSGQIDELRQKLTQAESVPKNEQDPEAIRVLKDRILTHQGEQALCRQMNILLQEGDQNPVDQYAQALLTGQIDSKAARSVIEAMRGGDIQAAVTSMMEGLPGLSVHGKSEAEAAAIMAKRKEIMKGVLKYGGGTLAGMGILAAILAALAVGGAAVAMTSVGSSMRGQ